MNDGVRIDVVLIQGPSGLVQPLVLTWPPDSVVGPIHSNVCNNKMYQLKSHGVKTVGLVDESHISTNRGLQSKMKPCMHTFYPSNPHFRESWTNSSE